MSTLSKQAARRTSNAHLPTGVPHVPPPAVDQPTLRLQALARTAPRNQFTSTLFTSELAWSFYERHHTRTVITERTLVSDELPMMYLRRNPWTTFLNPTVIPNISLIQEFYANLAFVEGDVVYVRGRNVDISPAAIRVVLDLLEVQINHEQALLDLCEGNHATLWEDMLATLCGDKPEEVDWEWNADGMPKRFDERNLALRFKAWHRFVISNMTPTTNTKMVTYEQALILFSILKATPLDVAQIIRSHINHCVVGKKVRSWFFPSLITNMCVRAGVESFTGDLRGQLSRPLSIHSFTGEPASPPPPPPPARGTASPVALRARDFNRTQRHMMEYMHTTQQRLDDSIHHLHDLLTCDPLTCTLDRSTFPAPFDGMNP